MISKNIVLIGFMGTGKTSVGKILAAKLGWSAVDVDACIEAKTGKKIAEIFETEGEPHFRALEKEAVREVSGKREAVITTGGGVVLDPDNLAVLRENGIVVALSATPETVYKRVKHSKLRPLLQGPDMLQRIQALYESRRPLYESADLHFDTDGSSASQIAERVLAALKEK